MERANDIEHYNNADAELKLMKSPPAETQVKVTSATGECYASVAAAIWRGSRTITIEKVTRGVLDIFLYGKDGAAKAIEGFVSSPEDAIKEALKLLNNAALQYEELGMAEEELNTYFWISLCMAMRGDVDKSVKYAATAKKILEDKLDSEEAATDNYRTSVEIVYDVLAAESLIASRFYDGTLDDFMSMVEKEAAAR